MEHTGYRRAPVATLILPGDWKRRLESPAVQQLAAEALTRGFFLLDPIACGRRVLFGSDVVAAAHLNGWETVWVKRVKASRAEQAVLIELETPTVEIIIPTAEERRRLW